MFQLLLSQFALVFIIYFIPFVTKLLENFDFIDFEKTAAPR